MERNNSNVSCSTTSPEDGPSSGYDLPVYGLHDGSFYKIHIPALTCIFLSLCSVAAILILSFRFQSYKTFFKWTRSERFVVYLAFCDGLFNIAHSLDHLHILITRNHVHPRELCEFYGFMLMEFITAQVLMVNIIAMNAFVLIYFRRQINYGGRDWKLLIYTFGLPFLSAVVAGIMGALGPNGTFCYFDGVKGKIFNILFTTGLLLLIFVINTVLYTLTWCRIHVESKSRRKSIGDRPTSMNASHVAARTMSLFVAAFFVQWWAMGLYGIWQMVDTVPQVVYQFVTTFSNVGGIVNGVVYFIIRRRRILAAAHKKGMKMRTSKTTSISDAIAQRESDQCSKAEPLMISRM